MSQVWSEPSAWREKLKIRRKNAIFDDKSPTNIKLVLIEDTTWGRIYKAKKQEYFFLLKKNTRQ